MKFAFYSTMQGMNWGGSETLWSRAARRLLSDGDQVAINFPRWPDLATPLAELRSEGAELFLRARTGSTSKLGPIQPLLERFKRKTSDADWLRDTAPRLLLITLGYHLDPIPLVNECQRLGIPYVIQLQCASANRFVPAERVATLRNAYESAARVLVVSEENLEKVEANLGVRLSNAELIANPFGVPWETPFQWPISEQRSLACVGRIHFASKGQDLLVHVLKQPRWRDRSLEITLYGQDQGDRARLESLIAAHGLERQLKLGGYQSDLNALWQAHHGLILPSRFEGAALVVVEAMLAHRMVVATDTGRNREWIDDGRNGFLAPGATTIELDAALERAWTARDQWRELGRQAGIDIRDRFPQHPVEDFTTRLRELASD